MSTLYMMLGYPGAGKTTVSTYLQKLTGAEHLNSDKLRLQLFPKPTFSQAEHDRLYEELNTQTAELLTAGKDVIYDANLNRRIHRQEKYDLCQQVGAKPVLIWVQTAKPLAKERRLDDAASHRLVPAKEDPASMFERLVDVFEEPGPEEPYTTIDGTLVTEESLKHRLGL